MECSKCGSVLSPKRTSLGSLECVGCSTVEVYGCVNIINHKTGNTVQALSKSQAQAINKAGDRKRFGTVLQGGSKNDSYNPKHTFYKVSTSQVGSEAMFEQVGQNMMLFLETKGINSATAYVNKQLANSVISQRQLFTLVNLMNALTAG